MEWKEYFDIMIDWKKLPAYKAETRIDSLIGFFLKSIISEYLKDEILSIKGKGNAYGMVNKDKHVLLQLAPGAAAYFKRERQFEREEFEFITENFDESVSIKMYYNNTDEIKHLIQGWMPQIKIEKESDLKNKIYAEIQSHCLSLIGIDTLSNQAKKENI